MTPIMCSVYRSSKHEEMYLYVPRGARLDDLPDDLRSHFGRALPVMDLLLRPERRLARADVEQVMTCLADQGFYLQMPPNPLTAGLPHA